MTIGPPSLPPIPGYPASVLHRHHQPLPFASLAQHNIFLHDNALFNHQHPFHRLHFPGPIFTHHEINRVQAIEHEFKKPLLPVPRRFTNRLTNDTDHHPNFSSGKKMDNAMLSTLSYGEAESLHDGAFEMSNNLNMSDSMLSSNTSVNTPTGSFDIFDGHGHIHDYSIDNAEDLRLSPHNFVDSGSNDFDIDDEDSSNHSDNQYSHEHGIRSADSSPGQSDNSQPVPDRPRGKGRPAKVGGPIGRNGATCPICNKHFNNSSALAKHKLTHSDERKYVCRICSKAFKRQDHLNGHMMTHESKKPFACKFENCDKSYCDARSLRRHVENHHQQDVETLRRMQLQAAAMAGLNLEAPLTTNNKILTYEPQYTSNSSDACRSPGYLSQVSPISPAHPTSPHNLTTSRITWPFNPMEEPKPVQCTLCNRRFKNIPALNGHMRLHGGYFKRDGDNPNIVNHTKTDDSSKSDLMPPPPPKKEMKKQIGIPTCSSSLPNTLGITTINNAISMPTRSIASSLMSAVSSHSNFSMDHALTTNSIAISNQLSNSLQLHPSDLLNQHDIMSGDIHQNSIQEDQNWTQSVITASAVEHVIFGNNPNSCTDSQSILENSVMQDLSEKLNGGSIMESFNHGEVTQVALQGMSDGNYQQHNQYVNNHMGYQGGNVSTITTQIQLHQHPATPIDSPAVHTPHPSTPAHAATPNHPLTPVPQQQQQPHTPHTPLTPNSHTPNNPLTPTHRQQQQSRYFLFPPRQQLQESLTNPIYPQGDHLQSPHPSTPRQSPHPNMQALRSPHPQVMQNLQSPHPQHSMQSTLQHHNQSLPSSHTQQALQSPHPQILHSPHPHSQHSQMMHSQAIQSPHPHSQGLQSPHPHTMLQSSQHMQGSQQNTTLQSPHPHGMNQALTSPHIQHVPQSPHNHTLRVTQQMATGMHPPQSSLQTSMMQSAMHDSGPLHSPMIHQQRVNAGMQSLHSPMVQNQVQQHHTPLQSPLPQHHTSLQSPLPQSQNLQQQGHHFNFSHHHQQPIQVHRQQVHYQQKQQDETYDLEFDRQKEILQVERKLLEDLENFQNETPQKQLLQDQLQQLQFQHAEFTPDLESDLPIIHLQPPPPPRCQRQNSQHLQEQTRSQDQEQDIDQILQSCKNEDDMVYRSASAISDDLSQIMESSGDLSVDHIHDLLVMNMPQSMRDSDLPDRKRSGGKDPEEAPQPKRPCHQSLGKPNSILFKSQADNDLMDVNEDEEGNARKRNCPQTSTPRIKPLTSHHRPRQGKQMRLIEAANRQCAGTGNGSSNSSSSGSQGTANTSTPPNSGHSVSSQSSSLSSGFTSSGGGSSASGGAGGGNPDDGVFRNPSIPATPMKGKKKHRPEPLIIPPHVNHFGFASRLRSPRLWEGGTRGMTPPPYTPPPMLSPVRSGAGLFWTIQPSYRPITPKSAPHTPRMIRKGSLASVAPPQEVIVEEVEEEEIEPPPETDIQPHVNIGDQFQAPVPDYLGSPNENIKSPARSVLLWDPTIMHNITEEEIQYYQDFACCAAIPGNGTNKEYALHLLYLCKGNIKKAMLRLMQGIALVPESHSLKSYKYQETDMWTTEEIEGYHQGLIKCDKDFFTIAKQLGTKTVKQCVQFYYLWKKVCTDEYRKLRQVRRKREQDELYNLRSRTAATATQVTADNDTSSNLSPKPDEERGNFHCDYTGCSATFSSKQALNGHIRIHGGHARVAARETSPCPPSGTRSKSPSPGPPSNKSTYSEDADDGCFPCKICGRVFTKVKSRSAHMKSHRQVDNPKQSSYHYDDTG